MNIKEDINNIILAIYLSIPIVSKIIVTFLPFENNIIILTVFLLIVFLAYNIKKIIITKKFIIINLIVFLTFLISFLKVNDNKYTIYYLMNYFLYGSIAIFFIQYKYEYRRVFQYINLIFIIFTPILLIKYIPLIKTSANLNFMMDLSYSVLIGITATVINFKYCKSKAFKTVSTICLIINLYYLVFLNNNRGSILAILVFMIIYLLRHVKNRKRLLIILSIAIIILIPSRNVIIDYIENVDTNISWIKRLQFQIKQDNITSDRDILYNDAIEIIKDNIFTGIGIGEFENDHRGGYTHNIFLQMACENGIIWALTIGLYILICSYKNIIKTYDTEENIFLMFLFVQFIPRLLLSSVQWLNPYIWIYIYMNLCKKENM